MALDCLAHMLRHLLDFASVPAVLAGCISGHVDSVCKEGPASMLIVIRNFGYSEHISFPEFRLCVDVEHLAACLPGNGAAPVVLDAVIPFAAA